MLIFLLLPTPFGAVNADADGLVVADVSVRFAPILTFSLLPTFRCGRRRWLWFSLLSTVRCDRSHCTVSSWSMVLVRSWPTQWVSAVLDLDVLVLLGMDEQLLGALLVLHADLVEVGRRAAPARTALGAASG